MSSPSTPPFPAFPHTAGACEPAPHLDAPVLAELDRLRRGAELALHAAGIEGSLRLAVETRKDYGPVVVAAWSTPAGLTFQCTLGVGPRSAANGAWLPAAEAALRPVCRELLQRPRHECHSARNSSPPWLREF